MTHCTSTIPGVSDVNCVSTIPFSSDVPLRGVVVPVPDSISNLHCAPTTLLLSISLDTQVSGTFSPIFAVRTLAKQSERGLGAGVRFDARTVLSFCARKSDPVNTEKTRRKIKIRSINFL